MDFFSYLGEMSSAFLGYFDKSITSHVLDTVMCFYNTKYNNLLMNVDESINYAPPIWWPIISNATRAVSVSLKWRIQSLPCINSNSLLTTVFKNFQWALERRNSYDSDIFSLVAKVPTKQNATTHTVMQRYCMKYVY